MHKLLQDFKDFAMKGNVVDMAVGVIIGGAFGKIITSLVSDVMMPLIGLLIGGVNFTGLKWVIKPETRDEAGNVIKEAATLNYGSFIQNVVDFLIIAACIFAVIKILTTLMRRTKAQEPAPAAPAPPEPTKEEQLLTEIRDILKEKK